MVLRCARFARESSAKKVVSRSYAFFVCIFLFVFSVQGIWEIFACGIWNTAQGFRIPLTIVPMTKKQEFGTWNQESGIHGEKSRDYLEFPYMGRISGLYLETRWF